jgi:hypothetical protein
MSNAGDGIPSHDEQAGWLSFEQSPQVHDLSHYPPPTLLQFSAAPHTLLIGSSGAHP